ncbi:MAG: TIGR03118 family protein [Candidatus Methanoperedens sp.]
MLRNIVNSVFTLKIAIGTIVMALILISGGATAQETTWHVLVGGETTDMSLQGLGFYPGVITINEGDRINWTVGASEPHTVSFLSGDSIPEPGSPATLLPIGGFIYNGTGHVSSGIMLPGMNYTLNFTEPGVYTYQCLLHPGMGGVVIVQPNGSSYPFTQDQYETQGMEELEADLFSGQHLVDNLSVSSAPGPNGTTIWQAAADIPLPMNANVVLSQENNSGANGSTALNFIGPGMIEVQVKLSGLAPNSVHPAHIHAGTCEAGGPILYPLNNLTADAEGNVTNTTIINGLPWLAIQNRGWFVNVHQGPTMSDGGATPIACGDIEQNYAAYMRFAPDPLTIHTDDTIVWTQMNFMMIHTVTFPVAGQPVPEFILPDFSINPVAAAPAGGSVYNGTDFFNSGILSPGQNYTLTFTKPGTYDYLCLIHDEMGMKGKIIVLPPEEQTKFEQTNLVSDVPNLAQITDPNLVNSWGIAHLPTGPWWVADNGMGVSTVYNGNGTPFPVGNPLVVTVPGLDNNSATPTGIVANIESVFNITAGNPAKFVFVTEDGTISAWNPNVDPTKAILMVNNSPDAVYKGVTIDNDSNGTFLYAANFRQGRIDVFDTDFKPVTMDMSAFVDSQIPAGFAPFNIQMVDGNLVVTFAQVDDAKHDEVDGPGLGYVDIFDPDGKLIMRLEHGDWLNAPWGAAMAPANFGNFGNDLLIGNFGSGQISAFDEDNGSFKGLLENESNEPIVIDGLWGLGFGNDANAGSSDTLFFAAGINKEQDGLFGNIAVSQVVVVPVLTTITVSPSTAMLSIGDSPVFTATAVDQNGNPMEGINITWTSSDTAIGTVSPDDAMTDANGNATTTFTANANGTAMVNATNGSVTGSAEVVVGEEIEEINIIKNPGFESGRKNWIFYTNGTGRFDIISPGFEGNASEVRIISGGSNVQLYQKGLTLKPNTHYKLSFAAKSSRGHDVRVVLLKHGSPYTNYGLKQNFNLTEDWQTFTTEFDTKHFTGTVDDGRLMFYLAPFAKAGDKYDFDSVKLEEVQ